MSAAPHESASCSCGQVVFDTSGRKVGALLACPWCQKEYRYLGSGVIAPYESSKDNAEEHKGQTERKEEKLEAAPLPQGERPDNLKAAAPEEKKQEEPGEAERAAALISWHESQQPESPPREKAGDGGVADRMKSHAARRKRQQAAITAAKGGNGGDKPKTRTKARRAEIPGGPLRMVAFIVVSNAIALLLLHILFPEHRDGTRETPWGGIIPRFSVPWPLLVTLLIGHLCGFAAWAWDVYRLLRNQQGKAALQIESKQDESKPDDAKEQEGDE
ncbi:MAG: hypothetical protein ABSE73_14055 [Planctomycetota bacterium]